MEWEWTLPASLGAAKIAREHVARELTAAGAHEEAVHDAILVASELAANAVRHGAPPITLKLATDGDQVRISLRDHGVDGNPVLSPADGTAGHGRGLAIIETLARRTGWDRDATGLTVWAELPLGTDQ